MLYRFLLRTHSGRSTHTTAIAIPPRRAHLGRGALCYAAARFVATNRQNGWRLPTA